MRSISIKIPEDTDEALDAVAREEHDGNRSEAIRALIDKGLRYDDRVTDLEIENERLHRERRQLLDVREENTELVRYAETERAYREGSLLERVQWFVTGMD